MNSFSLADIILFAIIAAAAIWGLKSGFVKAFFQLGYYIISTIAALIFYPMVSDVLMNSALSQYIHDKIILPRLSVDTGALNLPSFLQMVVAEGVNSTTQTLAASLTEMAVKIICFVVVFILVRFGLKFAVKILDTIVKLPLLKQFNKLGGLAVGVLNGVVLCYIVLALASVFANDKIHQMIIQSQFAIRLYDNNLLLKLIFG
jgi:uncharacterized membrane protein required for colicin V production